MSNAIVTELIRMRGAVEVEAGGGGARSCLTTEGSLLTTVPAG